MKGKVKWFDNRKGYGYITGDDGKDYFIHRNNIEKGRTYIGFNNDDEVEFEASESKKGFQATGVSITEAND